MNQRPIGTQENARNIIELCQWLWDRFRVSVSQQTLGRELRAMGYRKLSARARHHEQAEGASKRSKKFPATLATIAGEHGIDPGDVEVWFGDQARVGQKNRISRRRAKRGTRPSAPHDQRTASTYIFGAICPAEGKAAGLMMPGATPRR